jgi:hypothetical protein
VRWVQVRNLSESIRRVRLFTHAVKRPSDQDGRPERASRNEGSLPKRHFTRAVKYNMLETRPPALCADRVRAPSRSGSHFWLCSVQSASAGVRDRVTALVSASLRVADSRDSRAEIATYLESYSCTDSCTNTSATSVESYSCEKCRGLPSPHLATPLFRARVPHPSVSRVRFFPARSRGGVNLTTSFLRAANLPKMGFTAARSGAELSIGFRGIRAYEAVLSSPLESALAQKWGWGVPPSGRFVR